MKLTQHLIAKLPLLLILALSILFITPAQAQAMPGPQDVVKQAVDSMTAKLQANRATYEADDQALYDMLEETLLPVLHVPRMADLILGKETSKSVSEQQKSAFIEEFKTFLLQSYASGLLNATGEEQVVYEPATLAPGEDKVKVKAKLVSASGEEFPITLSMSNRRDTRWRAYNLDIAGIDFIRTYRSSFSLTLKEKGIDGLIKDLRGKNVR
ncbi:MAG: phospholipid transport system substrate-binding protein [Arenicella sp.]|jgi:phospholipid transport system substrate-binding protein